MVKTPGKDQREAEGTTRTYDPEEFEADTVEERPIALLAERRRQFLEGLQASQTNTNPSATR